MASHKASERAADPNPVCFVVSPIGEEGTEIRKRADQVLRHVIRPPAAECGYNAIRADEISEPGMITSQVIQQIVDAPLVIADLTDRNANVYYELAIRHVIRKPLVQIVKKGEQLPFDVAGMRTIPVDLLDLDSIEEAKTEITGQIRSLEKNPSKLQSPISVSLDLKELRQSANPEQRSIADVLSLLGELRTAVGGIEKRFETQFPSDVGHRAMVLEKELDVTRRDLEMLREARLRDDYLLKREADAKYVKILLARAKGGVDMFVTTDPRVADVYVAAGWDLIHQQPMMVNGITGTEWTFRWTDADKAPFHPPL